MEHSTIYVTMDPISQHQTFRNGVFSSFKRGLVTFSIMNEIKSYLHYISEMIKVY